MSNPNPLNATPARAPRWFVVFAFVVLAGYGILLGVNSTVAAGGSDSSGYLNSARLMASGRLVGELRVPAEFGPVEKLNRIHFTPFGFFPTLDGTALPPPGQKNRCTMVRPFLKRSALLDIWKKSRSSLVIGVLLNQIVTPGPPS